MAKSFHMSSLKRSRGNDQESDAPKEYKVEWTKTAQRSLNQIVAYIAEDKPLAAEKFRQEIIHSTRPPA